MIRRSLFGMGTAVILAFVLTTAANAASYFVSFDTVDRVNGMDVDGVVTTNAANDALTMSGTVTGFGAYAGYSGVIDGLVLPPNSDVRWLWDGKISATPPLFSASGSSGILFTWNGGVDFANPYFDVSSSSYYLSVALTPASPGALPDYIPGLAITASVTPTPLPASIPLFASGLAGLGFLARRRRSAAAA